MNGTVTRCIHRCLSEQAHEFVLLETSIPAVAELFDITDQIMQVTPHPRSLKLLIDTSVGVQPVGYCLTRIREMARKYPKREATRVAFILNADNPFIRIFDIVLRQFGEVRFFQPAQREEAIRWLLKQEDPTVPTKPL